MQARPINRHATNSVCSQMYATLAQREQSAKKLLMAVELSEKRSKQSVASLKNKSVDSSFGRLQGKS